ncbi:MAG: hypothetical protein AB8G11_02405 [Saprospiraceae bacterium]
MILASKIYEDFLHDLFHQETSTVTPSEFNRLAKSALNLWLEEIRKHYDKHEMLLDNASILVETITLQSVSNIITIPDKTDGFEYAFILRVEFDTDKCIDKQLGVLNRQNHGVNYYQTSSNYEVFYTLEEDKIIPKVNGFVVNSADVKFLKYPNIFSVDDNGVSVVDSDLTPLIIENIIKLMLQLYKMQHTN